MKIALIGSGIAGLGAAWLLHEDHEIVVYEKQGRIGGHSNTVDAPKADGSGVIPVDTGFIVYNEATYPNLIALFDRLGVATEMSNMSFAVSIDGGRLEYSGDGLSGLFAQRRNALRPDHYRMIADILRFYKHAPIAADDALAPDRTLRCYLDAEGYSRAFVDDHLLPMAAAIWSASPGDIAGFPLRSFLSFFRNHGLLERDFAARPQWYTVTGGSRAYVDRLTAPFRDRIRVGTGAVAVTRTPTGVIVRDSGGGEERFDQIVLASHTDESLGLLTDPSPEERAVLGGIRYADNTAYLHRDSGLMPRRRRAWASWNYLADRRTPGPAAQAASVTYWMNLLQNIDRAEPLFVSLNPPAAPRDETVIAEFTYGHPQFDRASAAAQAALGDIQGLRRTWYCGAWAGYGFHEDGLSSGLAVAEAIAERFGGRHRPWPAGDVSPAGLQATPRASLLTEAAE